MPTMHETNPDAKGYAQFEQFHSEYTPGGLRPGNPYVYREFPLMLIKAQPDPNGKMVSSMPEPRRALFEAGQNGDDAWNYAKEEVVRFNESCQMIVHDPAEKSQYMNQGWRVGHEAAKEFHLSRERSVAIEAAERLHRDQTMSEQARAESDKFEAENYGHQGEIKEQPSLRGHVLIPASKIGKKPHPFSKEGRALRAAAKAAQPA